MRGGWQQPMGAETQDGQFQQMGPGQSGYQQMGPQQNGYNQPMGPAQNGFQPMGQDTYAMPNQPMSRRGAYGPRMSAYGQPTPQQIRRASQAKWRQRQREEAPANAAWAQNKYFAPRSTQFY
jgi:hypothetical protein